MFRPMRKPARKTVAPRSIQTGQIGRPRTGRPVKPIHAQRAIKYRSGGYASGAEANTLPRLKNHSDTEKESSITRSRLRHDKSRRKFPSPSRNAAQKPSHTE